MEDTKQDDLLVEEQDAQAEAKAPPAEKSKRTRAKKAEEPGGDTPAIKALAKLDPNATVCVRSGHDGTVRYRGKDGSLYIWESLGVEQFMTVAELRYIASAKSRFLSEGWLQVDDPLVIEALQLERFCGNVLTLGEMEGVFDAGVAEIGTKLAKAPPEQRRSVARMARQKILDGSLNRLDAIRAIEEALKVHLIESE
jgi:hypothetical protein